LFNEHWLYVGRLLAIKGPNWVNEKQEALEEKLLESVEINICSEYSAPGAEWKSVILELRAKRAPV
jgi:16S rRNA (guanine527-N7)-methyltransferase